MLFSMFLIPLDWLNCCLPMQDGSTRFVLSLLIANYCFKFLDITSSTTFTQLPCKHQRSRVPSVHTYSFFLGALLTSGGITIAKSRSHLTCILSFVGRGH